jgi:NADH:ubiquinone oxidoreductase subunit 2 (subunit N)
LELLAPELFLAVALSALLIYGVTMSTTLTAVEKGNSSISIPIVQGNRVYLSVIVLLFAAGILLMAGWPKVSFLLCDGVLIFDGASFIIKRILFISTAFVFLVSYRYRVEEGLHIFEFSVLLLVAVLGLSL